MDEHENRRHGLDLHIEALKGLSHRLWGLVPAIETNRILRESLQQASEIQRSIQHALAPVFEEVRDALNELPPRTRDTVLMLGEHGWYLDLEMSLPEVLDLNASLAEGRIDEAEQALSDHFENRLEQIEGSIASSFPLRARLIKSAFNAHRRGEYELSIPVLLAQTDGICKEVSEQYLFRRRDKNPAAAKYVERISADGLLAALLSPLAKTLPINAPESERGQGWTALNRHEVLHGDSLTYDNKMNGLKAVSLINYVSQMLCENGPEEL